MCRTGGRRCPNQHAPKSDAFKAKDAARKRAERAAKRGSSATDAKVARLAELRAAAPAYGLGYDERREVSELLAETMPYRDAAVADIAGDTDKWNAVVAHCTTTSGEDALRRKASEWRVRTDDLRDVTLRHLRKYAHTKPHTLPAMLSAPLDYVDLWQMRDAARAVGERRRAKEIRERRSAVDDPLAAAQGLHPRGKSAAARVPDDALYLAVGDHDDARRAEAAHISLIKTEQGVFTSRPPALGSAQRVGMKNGKRWVFPRNLEYEVLAVEPATVFDGRTIYQVELGEPRQVD